MYALYQAKNWEGLYVLRGELGVSQAFLARWYIGGGYMYVSEVVVFYDCGKIYVQNSILSRRQYNK